MKLKPRTHLDPPRYPAALSGSRRQRLLLLAAILALPILPGCYTPPTAGGIRIIPQPRPHQEGNDPAAGHP